MKCAQVDDAGTSRPTAEEILSLAPMSRPVPGDSPPAVGPTEGDLSLPSPEATPVVPAPADPVVVSSGDGSLGAGGSGQLALARADLELRGQPSGSSGSIRRGELPSDSVRGTAKMVKVRILPLCN